MIRAKHTHAHTHTKCAQRKTKVGIKKHYSRNITTLGRKYTGRMRKKNFAKILRTLAANSNNSMG